MRFASTYVLRIAMVCLLVSSQLTFATTPVVPTTTLAAETGNNTSTSPTFAGTVNGNLAGNQNISKVDVTSLLYPGSTTKVYAHLMAWFGGSSHVNVGYASNDPAQVTRQVNDMLSRGVSGAIIDWYGPNNTLINNASIYVKQESEKHTNFEFAIMEDKGALNSCANTAGCDVTGRMIQDLTYAYNTFEQSAAYMRVGGRPLVFFFGTEALTIDWTRARAGVPGNPLFIFRNNSSFTHSQTGGGYSWTGITTDPTNMGLSYLDGFYYTAKQYPALYAFGSSYKGFNDSIASWGQNRLINQQCGQTWLATMAEAGKYYSTSNQLDAFQLVTWNDYEEGTALEMGIDNCVGISTSVTGNTLSWVLSGQANTIDHYTVFISLDGVNLMPLANVAAGTTSLNLGSFSLAPAAYKIFVKAIGKPFLTNKMSGAVSYTVANLPPTVMLSATPTSGAATLLVSANTTGSKDPDGTIASTKLDFGDGTVVNAASGSHSYTAAGTYILKATVTDNLGATASTTASIAVQASANEPPVAKLSVTPTSGTAPVTVTASTAGSTDPDGTIASTKIDFGDGTILSAASGTHVYSVAGSFVVKATVTDNLGTSSSATATVVVTAANKPPVAKVAVTPSSGKAALTVTASTTGSSDPDGTIASTKIDFGDGTVLSATSGTHVYSTAGSFVVKATVTDNLGASSSATATVTVTAANKPPVAMVSVTPTSGTAALTVTASTSGSSDPDGTIASTKIDFGDGTVLSATSGTHVYSTAGSFVVKATVTDNLGASSSATATVTVSVPVQTASAVTISAPLNNAAVSRWVTVAASASGSVSIAKMQLYVDGVLKVEVAGNKMSTLASLTSGAHQITVRSVDVNGGLAKSSVNVTAN
jgi:PKD repeat protein